MAKYAVTIDDTITLSRSWRVEVEADSEDAAAEKVRDMAIAGELGEPKTEDEIDNQPYEVQDVEPIGCRTEGCDGDPNNGDGWDGYCGNCADRHDT